MSSRAGKRVKREVDRAQREALKDEIERTRGSARREAAARAAAVQHRRGFGRFLFENGLTLAMLALFLLSFSGQVLAGRATYNEELRQHGQPAIGVVEYVKTGAFIEATAENWESEFLQMAVFVLLTAFLYQRGSSESKRIEEPEPVDQDPREARNDPEAPWPVRRGRLALAIYSHSLSIALLTLFAVSFVAHAIGGARDYNQEQSRHGEASVSTMAYVGTSRFWFESFQNWQSEFFSVAMLVVLSIWLRERGSAQSKPVGAGDDETGE